jgi:hypothetical protein
LKTSSMWPVRWRRVAARRCARKHRGSIRRPRLALPMPAPAPR